MSFIPATFMVTTPHPDDCEIGVGGTGRAHDAWFRGEVEQALREADDPNVQRIPNGDVRSDWQRQRAAIEKQSRTKTA